MIFPIAVNKSNVTVLHLMTNCDIAFLHSNSAYIDLTLGKNGKFAKTSFYFLRADPYALRQVKIKGQPVNLGDGDGMLCSSGRVWR